MAIFQTSSQLCSLTGELADHAARKQLLVSAAAFRNLFEQESALIGSYPVTALPSVKLQSNLRPRFRLRNICRKDAILTFRSVQFVRQVSQKQLFDRTLHWPCAVSRIVACFD